MTRLAVILGDQLDADSGALQAIDRARDVVLMMEVMDEATYVPHHKQKIVLVLSAMRHFAEELREAGYQVDYVRLDDTANSGSFAGEIQRAVRRHQASGIVVTHPGEHRVLTGLQALASQTGLPVELIEDNRFFSTPAQFAAWATPRREWRMEFFYRHMRTVTGLLMDGAKPAGGQWNFDAANRKSWPRLRAVPERLRFPPDATTQAVIDLVERLLPDHFGTLDGFAWAVTRADAERALDDFIAHHLPCFGDYQDAMRAGAPFLHHGLISPYLNIGLLDPRRVCALAERAYRQGAAPINAVEGFIRQILGWREYVRGVYWHLMPGYAHGNALGADQPLPAFYWNGETDMACVRDVVGTIRRHGYAHHIQRLMVTGNLALLWGVRPAEIEAWYLAVFVDAFDWVELPNTHGMAIHADGGLMASKPYAASGAYIDRMSNYCRGCRYDPGQRHGKDACPMTLLYWDFLARHETRFAAHPRMKLVMDALSRLPRDAREAIRADAAALRCAGTDRSTDHPPTALF
jgi:deoxyribodipyrimidine photolyase-related protein